MVPPMDSDERWSRVVAATWASRRDCLESKLFDEILLRNTTNDRAWNIRALRPQV